MMSPTTSLIAAVLFTLSATGAPQDTTDAARAALHGPVRRVRVEVATMQIDGGRPVEGPRITTEDVSYDEEGARVRAELYPLAEPVTQGNEIIRRGSDGRPVERRVLNAAGILKRREQYTYADDAWGNWTLQWTLLAIVADGKPSVEPIRVVHRQITYFYEPPGPELTEATTPANTTTHAAATNAPATIPARISEVARAVYPIVASHARVSGVVVVRVSVDEQGAVTKAEAVSGHNLLRGAAIDAARRSRYQPARRDGMPAAGETFVTYNFTPKR